MDFERLIKFIKDVPKGRFFRLRYLSHLPVKAQYEKMGISIMKIVNVTTRTGIRYAAVASVEYKPIPQLERDMRTSHWEWEIKDKIKFNTNTKKRYLVIAPIKGNKSKSTYILTNKDGTVEIVERKDIQEMIIDSYWRKEPDRPIHNICFDNILSVY